MVYGYIRVSTEYQDHDSQRNLISKQYKVKKWCEDVGTGRIIQKNLSLLINKTKKGDTIIISAFDRLGRNAKEVISVVEKLKSKNVSLISINEKVDLTSSAGNLVFQMMCSVAEFEASMVSDRVKSGLDAAKKRGIQLGKPRLDKNKDYKKALNYAVKRHEKGEIGRAHV